VGQQRVRICLCASRPVPCPGTWQDPPGLLSELLLRRVAHPALCAAAPCARWLGRAAGKALNEKTPPGPVRAVVPEHTGSEIAAHTTHTNVRAQDG